MALTNTPERKLLVSMLQRALFDYFGDRNDERVEAEDWLFDLDEGDTPFSFSWVCLQLDIDPYRVISRVQKMPPRDAVKTQKWWGMQRAVGQ